MSEECLDETSPSFSSFSFSLSSFSIIIEHSFNYKKLKSSSKSLWFGSESKVPSTEGVKATAGILYFYWKTSSAVKEIFGMLIFCFMMIGISNEDLTPVLILLSGSFKIF